MQTIALTVTVTQDHIDNGHKNSSNCPVSLAIIDAVIDSGIQNTICKDNFINLELLAKTYWKSGIRVFINGHRYEKNLREELVSSFINKFDFNKPVKPFRFGLLLNKVY